MLLLYIVLNLESGVNLALGGRSMTAGHNEKFPSRLPNEKIIFLISWGNYSCTAPICSEILQSSHVFMKCIFLIIIIRKHELICDNLIFSCHLKCTNHWCVGTLLITMYSLFKTGLIVMPKMYSILFSNSV